MTYILDCWIKPRSGFDMRDHNLMRSFLKEMFFLFDLENGTDLTDKVENIDKKHEGMVIHTFEIELNKKSLDIENDLLYIIHKDFPEAELITCTYMAKKG